MAVSFINLVGSREAPDKIIRYTLQTNWTAGNITGTITPLFQSASEEPDYIADDDLANEDIITVTWIGDERVDNSQNEPNGDTVHHWKHILRIDIYAQDMTRLLQFCDEVNNILWTVAPNSGTRLVKSDSSNSEIDYFEESEITFDRVDPPEGTIDFKPSTTGVLEAHFRKKKT